eukprot:gene20529-24649_t
MLNEFDPQQVAMMIAETKKMNQEILAFESTILPNLIAALEPLAGIQTLKSMIARLKSEQYSNFNESHEEKLEQLWDNLCPNVRRTGRHTSEWGEIGFQGKDPATDFRGMGILGLDNLLYLATTYPEESQKILVAANTQFKYPFAITGINLTSLLVNMLDKNQLRSYFMFNGFTTQQFNELYSKVFIQFNEFYQSKRPDTIMQFNTILKEYTAQLTNKFKEATYNYATNTYDFVW